MVGSLSSQTGLSLSVSPAETRRDFEDFFSECSEQPPDFQGLVGGGVEDGVDDDASLSKYEFARQITVDCRVPLSFVYGMLDAHHELLSEKLCHQE